MKPSFLTSLRSILASRDWRITRLNPQAVWLVLVMLAFLSVQSMSQPQQPTPVVAPALSSTAPASSNTPNLAVIQPSLTVTPSGPPTPTPFPPELVANREQTSGIIFGTVILVMIVILGTLTGITARRKELR